MADNPFVGPQAFTEANSANFHGRSTESRELISLILARRAVLLYAQSGAGKTSLLQASVIPELRRRKRVETLPVARVTGSETAAGNIYIANTIAALFPGRPELTGATLSEAIAATESKTPRLLILDQFEEIFTFHPERTDDRRGFFAQLGECLESFPRLCLLISMREDYLAFLDDYSELLPDRLRSRLRLTRLGVQNALEAVCRPASAGGRPFAPGVAENLVDNLRRLQARSVLGLEVEPVQLQIVCRQLWEQMPATATSIEAGDVEKFANVDNVLIRFYRDALAKARSPVARERTLRRWFGESLITASRTRGLVYEGDNILPDAAIRTLLDVYLIRPVHRGDDVWFELCHDRLVEPILEDNRAWFADYPNPLARSIKDKTALLSGSALADAVRYDAANPGELTAEEADLLQRSCGAERAAQSRRRRRIAITAAVMILLAGLVVWARERERQATENLEKVKNSVAESLIMEASLRALDRPDEALAFLEESLRYDPASPDARTWIASLLTAKQRWLPVDTGVAVAHDPSITITKMATGLTSLSRGATELATMAAADITTAAQVDQRIFTRGQNDAQSIIWEPTWNPASVPVIRAAGQVNAIAFLPGGQLITLADRVEVWDIATAERKAHVLANTEPNYFDISADGRFAIVGKGTGSVQVVEIATGNAVTLPHLQADRRASLSPDGSYAATYGAGGLVQFWETKSGSALFSVPVSVTAQDRGVPRVAFSRDHARAAVAGSTSLVVHNLKTGQTEGTAPRQPQDLPQDLALNTDGSHVASVSRPGLILVYDVQSGRRAAPAMIDGTYLTNVKFTSDGRRILSAAAVGARLWDLHTGRPATLPIAEEKLSAIAISPDGHQVATASADGLVHVHNFAIDDGSPDTAPVLADLAGAVSGYRIVDNQAKRKPEVDRQRQLAALRRWADGKPQEQNTLAAFVRLYLTGKSQAPARPPTR